MNEIISIIPPFNDEPYDHYLALDICHENRPTSEEVINEIRYYMYGNSYLVQVKRFEELPELTYNFTPITKSTTKTQLARLLAEKNNSGIENEQLRQQITRNE
ncbi:hypothetical protein C1645_823908 [Glomus cerebriforme]|uniref:Uncharacterized protein n=1 Tax=Glomus cerebriforme TaxID=658196 RepID=A0A397T1V5_9GLOM|nr:hypothetical protein C1645_823908 [Glomus cerebriforme]